MNCYCLTDGCHQSHSARKRCKIARWMGKKSVQQNCVFEYMVIELLTEVRRLVMDAVPRIQSMRHDIVWKPDGSPVTSADIWLENEVRDLVNSRLPNLVFIGEESWISGTAIEGEWFAVLDPIDGTENFCSGLKEWGTSLSLWRGETHAGSMLLLPELGETMLSGDIHTVPRSRIVGFSSSYHHDIGEGVASNPEARIMGCAVYNLFNVIRGSFARFVNPRGAYAWDLMAGVALAYEAGCEVLVNGKAYSGDFLEPNQRHRVDIRHQYDIHSRKGPISR